MSITNDVPSPSEAETPLPAPGSSAELLRALLDRPIVNDDNWQTEAGRAVSRVAVEFLNEVDDVAALRAVALLGLAQSLGVKGARKRTIKLSRWLETPPPPLATLPANDEKRAALVALTKQGAMWSRSYALHAIADPGLPEELVPEILLWARATYADAIDFAEDFYAPQIAGSKTQERTKSLLRDAARLLKSFNTLPAARLAQGLESVVNALLKSQESIFSEEKNFEVCISTGLALLETHAARAPAILLQPEFVMVAKRVFEFKSKNATHKLASTVSEKLMMATISFLASEIENWGRQAAIHWRMMVPTWRKTYSGWDASIAIAATTVPALISLASEIKEEIQEKNAAYASETAFARLLPAWDAFVNDLPEPSRASSVGDMLKETAAIAGILTIGVKGQLLIYDPLSHQIVGIEPESHGQVQIIRPGVQVRRRDGSSRVLVTALVTPVHAEKLNSEKK
jgi:hypothetical protein